jgi:hypothetical protein
MKIKHFSVLGILLFVFLCLCTGRLKAAEINAVPYISTYYIEPKVDVGKTVTINYYVTDAAQQEYLKDITAETFVVDYWVNGTKKTIQGVKAGDNSLTFPAPAKGTVLFSLQATDREGRKTHRLYHEFLATDPASSVIPKEKILIPDLANFGIYNDNTHPVETTKGLTEMLKWASDHGYRKVVLPKGTYRIDENSTVQMATRLTLDMNGSTFKLNPNALDKAMMLEMFQCYDSHIINGTFEGDLKEHDFKNAPNNSEWVCAINIGQGTQYSSFKDIKIIDVTGYGSNTSLGGNGTRTYSAVYPKSVGDFALGDINERGETVPSEVRTSSVKPLDITPFLEPHGFIQMGAYLGYQGNPAGNWVYKASFYDANQKFIESIEGYMYRRLYPPKNAKFARFTLFSTATPKNLTVFNFLQPYNCAFINVHHENIRCVGMVPSGFVNLLVEGNTFENCGSSSAKCAFDAEDGWDLMQDLTFRKNVFGKNPNNEFLTCAGHNFVMEDNVMKVYMWDRTKSTVFRNNKIKSAGFLFGTLNRSGYHRISNNTFDGSVSLNTQTATPDKEHCIRDNTINGTVGIRVDAKTQANSAYFYKCKITGGSLNGKFVKCDIKDTKNAGGTFSIHESTVENSLLKTSGNGLQSAIMDSTIKNCQVVTMGGTMTMKNNKLIETECTAVGDWSTGHEYILINNQVDTSLGHLVYVGNSYKRVILENNIINSTNPKFSVVQLVNPTNDKLTDQVVALTGNTINGAGGIGLNVQRLPHATCVMTAYITNNKLTNFTEYSGNLANAANVKILQEKPTL